VVVAFSKAYVFFFASESGAVRPQEKTKAAGRLNPGAYLVKQINALEKPPLAPKTSPRQVEKKGYWIMRFQGRGGGRLKFPGPGGCCALDLPVNPPGLLRFSASGITQKAFPPVATSSNSPSLEDYRAPSPVP
jgi:hypothetical protein